MGDLILLEDRRKPVENEKESKPVEKPVEDEKEWTMIKNKRTGVVHIEHTIKSDDYLLCGKLLWPDNSGYEYYQSKTPMLELTCEMCIKVLNTTGGRIRLDSRF